jgi:hypothetical protein
MQVWRKYVLYKFARLPSQSPHFSAKAVYLIGQLPLSGQGRAKHIHKHHPTLIEELLLLQGTSDEKAE